MGHIDIGEDEGDFPGTGSKQVDRLHAVAATHRSIAMVFEDECREFADDHVVVHHQDQLVMAVGHVWGSGAWPGGLVLEGRQKYADGGALTDPGIEGDKAMVGGDDPAHGGE